MVYVIKKQIETRLGVIEKTLGDKQLFYTATNSARKFTSVALARYWVDNFGDRMLADVRKEKFFAVGTRGGYTRI